MRADAFAATPAVVSPGRLMSSSPCATRCDPFAALPAGDVRPAMAGEPASLAAAGEATGAELVPAAVHWAAGGEASDAGYRLSFVRGGVDVGLDFQRRLAVARAGDARLDSAVPPGRCCPRSRSDCAASAPHAGEPIWSTGPSARAGGSCGEQGRHRIQAGAVAGVPEPRPRLSPRRRRRLTMRLRKGSVGIYFKRKF